MKKKRPKNYKNNEQQPGRPGLKLNNNKRMKKSKPTKSNDQYKILRMIARDEELERNDGKWVAMNRVYKDKKKYDRKRDKRVDLDSFSFRPREKPYE